MSATAVAANPAGGSPQVSDIAEQTASQEQTIVEALHEAAIAAGQPVGALELLRVANNYIFADRANSIIYRVPVLPRQADDLGDENQRLMHLAEAGAPILPPRHSQPWSLSTGHLATVWQLGQAPDPNPVVSLAPTLHALHQVEPIEGLPTWQGFERAERRIKAAQSTGVPTSLLDEIEGRLKALASTFPEWSTDTVVHGDPHLGNLVQTEAGHLLIDLDDLAIGCPEIDLATMRNAYMRFEGVPGSWQGFLDRYDSPVDLDLLDRFAQLRQLTMIAWLFSLWNLRDEAREEAIHRVATIDQQATWNAL